MWKKSCSKVHEKILDTPLNEEAYIHEVKHQSPRDDLREEHEEEGEYKHTILTNGGCANQRESNDGSLNYEGVPIDGCSLLYAGDIETIFENFVAIQNYHKREYEYLVIDNE